MSGLFITQNVPKHLVKRYKVSQAANNFCLNINDLGYFSKHIAIPPANVDGSFLNYQEVETGIEYHLCRFFPHKGIFKIINSVLDNLWLYWRVITAKEKSVWFYNVWTGNLLAYLLVKEISLKKTFILLADYNPSRYSGIIGKLLLWSIKRANGVISLSSRCREVNNNFFSIAGIIPETKIYRGSSVFHNNKSFLLSGTLNENTGLYLALEAFKEIPHATLFLSGELDGINKLRVEEYSRRYKNIIYKGFFDNWGDYLDFLQNVDFVLSLRHPESEVNHYNFPSKILEALVYNKIVISTIDYPELEGIYYLTAPYETIGFVRFITKLMNEDGVDIVRNSLNNLDVLVCKFSGNAWRIAFDKVENNNK